VQGKGGSECHAIGIINSFFNYYQDILTKNEGTICGDLYWSHECVSVIGAAESLTFGVGQLSQLAHVCECPTGQ